MMRVKNWILGGWKIKRCEDQEVSQVGSVTASLPLPCHCLPANQSSAFDLPQPLLIPLERAFLLSAFGEG